MSVQKFFIVDDEWLIAETTQDILIMNGVAKDKIEFVPVYGELGYKEALDKVIDAYRAAKASQYDIAVLMDFKFYGCEKNGGDFIGKCVEEGVPIETFIGVSPNFKGYSDLKGLRIEEELRWGGISQKSKEFLGLTEKGTETKPELDPHKQQDPPEDPPGSGML